MSRNRCEWAGNDPDYIAYHDDEWGEPLHDDRRLFEMLCLEGAQAGLSWLTILKRRDNYRLLFDNFEPETVARYDDAKTAQLLSDKRIIRNRQKIHSTVSNAQAFLRVQEAFGSFDAYLWAFVDSTPIINCFATIDDVPASTPLSETISKDMKQRGFSFFGPTICYAYMQSVGMVNDHTAACFKYPCS